GSLSRNVHWRSVDLGGELMTGSPGQALSLLSLAALADLGYQVDWNGADPFQLPQDVPNAARPPRLGLATQGAKHHPNFEYQELIYPGPFWWVDPQGSLSSHPHANPQRTKRG
ncbi:MAG: hypothetical protein Q6L68_10570, partial [Thermostichus sp. DG02_5_bins_236]